MKILHETVQTIPRLPFKYYEHDPLTDINVAPHWHQGIELNYLVSGTTLKFVTDGQTNEYRPGDLWTTNRRVVYSASGPTEVDWVEFGLIIDDDFLQTQIPASANWQLTLNGAASSKTHPQAYADVRQQLVTIHDLLTTPTTDLLRLQILSYFYQLLVTLGQTFTVPLTATTVSPNLTLTDTVMTAINQHYAEPIDGNTLAEQFHVSLTTLNQQFNANVQLSVNRYLRLIRLMNARRLLLETDHKIEYIAMQCGFPNSKTFNRNFKSWKGMTPTDYRQAYARYHRIDTSCL
ncbi:AraC family transcriptional regulator [Lactiplantibacillus plantarum subsp. plantarum]|uniref:AraC family transcriptional regulator n=1 Tax=Lactiplantibacillus plantarum TaxID=1590 RepID=UPI001BDDD8DB|nr:AraC family transcriptional regulator [Lactiplantibacillus plantarum]UOF05159.1 AraC family transcriptional regulator [Lactiplantibacillus plantarum subsp. plantarum]